MWEYFGAMRGKTNSKPSTNNTGIVRLENFVDAPRPRSSPTALHASATSSANAGRPGSTYVIRMFPANVKKTGEASIHNQRYERHPSSSAVRDSIPLRRIFQSMPSQTTHQGSVAPTAMVFVPCKDGISHNEIEDATKGDIGAGCQILLQAMVERANA